VRQHGDTHNVENASGAWHAHTSYAGPGIFLLASQWVRAISNAGQPRCQAHSRPSLRRAHGPRALQLLRETIPTVSPA